MDFVKKLASGEVSMEDNQEVGMASCGSCALWIVLSYWQVVTSGQSQNWADEFEKGKKSEIGGFWSQLENEWNDLEK